MGCDFLNRKRIIIVLSAVVLALALTFLISDIYYNQRTVANYVPPPVIRVKVTEIVDEKSFKGVISYTKRAVTVKYNPNKFNKSEYTLMPENHNLKVGDLVDVSLYDDYEPDSDILEAGDLKLIDDNIDGTGDGSVTRANCPR